ncbi:hypothetical protein IGI04_000216 [Brassica rapa subsp. trilocularis]|uniref:serine C-palmitoyltransferase n=1 Tax=Brassica rapa subsp. trilocularis TaxID=1813537 RepID=A0ABQ7NSE8_BRACM|nr:hypothetical protein IGI04_000216 [Brassica rapa subsp. trilocularis]
MDTNLVEMCRAGLKWFTMLLDAPSARIVLFGVRIQGHIFVEVLLGFVIVFLLSQKSYKPPQRPLTEQEIDELCDEWVPEPLIPPITQDMRHEPPVLVAAPGPGRGPKTGTGAGTGNAYPRRPRPPRRTRYVRRHQLGVPVQPSAAGPHTTVDGKEVVNFASANYLGLIGHEKLLESCTSALEKYGVGSCGPRGFYGTIDVHIDCETRISKFLGTPDTILYSYGLSTMFSTIPCFCKRGDIIVADEGVHWGIQNGLQLSRSTIVYFKHNDMDSLHITLEKIMTKNKRSKNLRRYINSGQIAPLDEIVKLKEKYRFRVILDESNSLGVLGRSGRGLAEHHGVPIEKIDVVTAAMGHALATEGGFCTGNARIIDYQRLSSSGYVFSASLPPYLASAAITAIDVIDQNPEFKRPDPESPIVFLKLEKSSGSTKDDLLLLEKMADRALKEDSLLVVSSKKSFLDKCRLPVGIKLFVSAGHSDSDLIKASESLKRLASELLL